ncbi:hypothetical protein [Vibrio hepatarius]|uniref:hypothetical protein n=1 Tax=Vibrio hepatarius TaxID=171383 RepID=UPI001C090D83|nr:hypothetical protein [Vibrio hepatarius]MBU2898624.1 hypothetical protein [Vibrio hepatarius]
MNKVIISLLSIFLLIPSMVMASNGTLDKISKSSEVNNLIGNSFLIHVKYLSSDFSNGYHTYYELKYQGMDSPNYFCANLKVNESANGGVEVVNYASCAQ